MCHELVKIFYKTPPQYKQSGGREVIKELFYTRGATPGDHGPHIKGVDDDTPASYPIEAESVRWRPAPKITLRSYGAAQA